MKARLLALLGGRRAPLVAALVGVVLALPSLAGGFRIDDHLHRWIALGCPGRVDLALPWWRLFTFVDGTPARTRAMVDFGVLPWWTDDGLRLSFLRPLSAVTHVLDFALWPGSPALMHTQSLLWYAALCALAGVLYRAWLGPTWVAGLAALLFAVDDAHGLPAGWLANRNVVIAAVLGLGALWAHDRARRERWRPGLVLAPALLGAGLLAGESAIATLAYLVAYALCLDDAKPARRAVSLAPYGVVVVAWQLAYRRLGFGAEHSAFYVDPGGSPLAFALGALERAPVLLFGQLTPIPIDLWPLLPRAPQLAFAIAGALVALGVLRLAAPIVRSDRAARFFLVGATLALVPVCATFPMGRLLVFVGFGAFGLLARVLVALSGPAEDRPVGPRVARAARVALVGTHLVAAPLLLPFAVLMPVLIGLADDHALASVPAGDEVAREGVVVLSAPGPFSLGYLPFVRAVAGTPAPARMLRLANGTAPLTVTRLDDRTLDVAADGASLAEIEGPMVRTAAHGLVPGQRIDVALASILVEAVDARGLPTRARFRFRAPFGSPGMSLLEWHGARFVPWRPPAIGETARFAPLSLVPE